MIQPSTAARTHLRYSALFISPISDTSVAVQSLEETLWRKELVRSVGYCLFALGIGNALGVAARLEQDSEKVLFYSYENRRQAD